MTTQEVKRKLAAILSADVKGYSRLMGEDEVGTIQTLNAYKEVMTGLIQHHRSRVVDAPGDNLLAEFASVVDAVQCAVEIQKEIKTRNAQLPENQKMEFRIGVNLGDVVEDGEQILGDGVNIAARLESLSEAGGICISGTAFDHVKNKLNLGYHYLGEQTVKNILEPVRVYKVLVEPEAAGKVIGEKRTKPTPWQKRVTVLVIILIVIAAAIAIWKFHIRPTPPVEVASKEKMSFPLPDKPSIAVLPFVNMSGDPKQEFFSDGITEEITTALSKVPQLFVISRQSSFSYKGKPVKVKQVSEELGVRYVLEGSVQRSADRIRINAQLIDAVTGHHLWAERYERDLKDIFALQDEIILKILTGVQVKLALGVDALRSEKYAQKYYRGKQGLDCYLKSLEAGGHIRFNIDHINLARRMLEETIAMCPEDPMAYIRLGWICYFDVQLGNTKSPQESLAKGIELAQKALAIDNSLGSAYGLLCVIHTVTKEYDKAISEGERAVALAPGLSQVFNNYGACLTFAGRPEEAIPLLQKAIRLNPFSAPQTYVDLGRALRMTGRFEEAVSACKKAIQIEPGDIFAHAGLVTIYIQMGREKEALAEAAEVRRIDPNYSVDRWAKTSPFEDQSETDKIVNALHKAGLK